MGKYGTGITSRCNGTSSGYASKYGGAIRSKSTSPVELWFTHKVIHSNVVINLGRATFGTEACLASW